MEERAALRVVVRGLVQGVFFRRFAYQHASALGLSGWVRNLPDGISVEVYGEGPRQRLEAFLALLRRGPHGARVESVRSAWVPPTQESGGFRIL